MRYLQRRDVQSPDKKNMILGIDVGGTTVKFAGVTLEGKVIDKQAFDTHAWEDSAQLFVDKLSEIILRYIAKHNIEGVGIGLPGLLSQDRQSTHVLANIPILNNQKFVPMVQEKIKGIPVQIENDAKCAALGEMYFGENANCGDYLFISIGTGVGGGYVLNGKLFIGSSGNATEIGHIPLKDGVTLEDHIGQEKITAHTYDLLKTKKYKQSILQGKELDPKIIYNAALSSDSCALDVFAEVGECIGETMIGVMRFADIHRFILGGGVAGAFEFIAPAMEGYLKNHLDSYYTEDLDIRPASLNAEAGILGAASLVMDKLKQVTA